MADKNCKSEIYKILDNTNIIHLDIVIGEGQDGDSVVYLNGKDEILQTSKGSYDIGKAHDLINKFILVSTTVSYILDNPSNNSIVTYNLTKGVIVESYQESEPFNTDQDPIDYIKNITFQV